MISFIIPTLNEESAISKTLKCLSLYSGPKEIIVSDGGSRDKTVEIARKFTEKVFVEDQNRPHNIASGRNFGASKASGDILLFLDGDIYIKDPDNFFKEALEFFEKNPKLAAMTVKLCVHPEMATFFDKIVFGYMNFFHFLMNNILRIGVSPGEFQMVRSEIFKKVGGFDTKLAASEDYDHFRRISKIGRTRFEGSLVVYHTGRRAHAIGWPRLLTKWFLNFISAFLFHKSVDRKWEEIR